MIAPAAIAFLTFAGHGKIGAHQKTVSRHTGIAGIDADKRTIAGFKEGSAAIGVHTAEIGPCAPTNDIGPFQQPLHVVQSSANRQRLFHKQPFRVRAVAGLVHRLIEVRDAQGAIVAQWAPSASATSFRMVRSAPLFDAGRIVGHLNVSATLRPVAWITSAAALGGLLLGVLVYALLQIDLFMI